VRVIRPIRRGFHLRSNFWFDRRLKAKADNVRRELTLKSIICLAIVFLFALSAAAQAAEQPETILAGIDIFHTKISEIVVLYGQPDGVYGAPAPYLSGTKQYKWGRLTLVLKVLTEPTASGDAITAIQIEGEGDDKPMSRTGRGLKLNDKAQRIQKVYGVEAVNSSARLAWSNGVVLLVHVNQKSRVDRIELSRNTATK
jgi:hypothetical protein